MVVGKHGQVGRPYVYMTDYTRSRIFTYYRQLNFLDSTFKKWIILAIVLNGGGAEEKLAEY